MKFLRNRYFLIGSGLIVAGVALIIGGVLLFRSPPKEITRPELEQLIASKGLIDGRVTPTPYAAVYEIEGKRGVGTGMRKVGTRTEYARRTTTQNRERASRRMRSLLMPGFGHSEHIFASIIKTWSPCTRPLKRSAFFTFQL